MTDLKYYRHQHNLVINIYHQKNSKCCYFFVSKRIKDYAKWFWEVLTDFSREERQLFLRFVWGRTRLPRSVGDFRGRDFVIQVMDKYKPPNNYLPEAYTCFFLLKMPKYTSKTILKGSISKFSEKFPKLRKLWHFEIP